MVTQIDLSEHTHTHKEQKRATNVIWVVLWSPIKCLQITGDMLRRQGHISVLIYFETLTYPCVAITTGLRSPTDPHSNRVNEIKFLGTVQVTAGQPAQLAHHDSWENYL